MFLNQCFLEFMLIEALKPESQWKKDVNFCLIKSCALLSRCVHKYYYIGEDIYLSGSTFLQLGANQSPFAMNSDMSDSFH